MELIQMKTLANEIHNALLDMDFLDYEETNEMDLKNLENDLKLLKKMGNGILLNAIQMLLENN
jgi:hypothetical protein